MKNIVLLPKTFQRILKNSMEVCSQEFLFLRTNKNFILKLIKKFFFFLRILFEKIQGINFCTDRDIPKLWKKSSSNYSFNKQIFRMNQKTFDKYKTDQS